MNKMIHSESELIAHLDEQNSKVASLRTRSQHFSKAREFLDKPEVQKALGNLTRDMSPGENLQEAIFAAIVKSGKFGRPEPVSLEFVAQQLPSGAMFYMPIKATDNFPLDNEVRSRTFGSISGMFVRLNPFVFNGYNGTQVIGKSYAEIEESLKVLNREPIFRGLLTRLIPYSPRICGQPWNEIPLTKSAIDYSLIPLRKEHRSLFPAYDTPFKILMGNMEVIGHVTSKVDNAPETTDEKSPTGNYICTGGVRDETMRTLFAKNGVRSNDTLQFQVINPGEFYLFRKWQI